MFVALDGAFVAGAGSGALSMSIKVYCDSGSFLSPAVLLSSTSITLATSAIVLLTAAAA